MRASDGAWIGWHGRRRERARAVRRRRHRPGSRSPLSRRGGRGATTRASPTPRCGRSTTTSSRRRSSTGTGGTPTREVNRALRRGGRRGRAEGATVWVHDYQLQLVPAMLRELPPGPADRLLPAHPVPADRAVPAAAVARGRSSRGCSAPTWSASSAAAAAQNFVRLVRQRRRSTRPTATWSTCPTAAPCAPRRSRSRSTRAGSRSSPGPRRSRRGPSEIREALGNPRKVLLGVDRLDYTKGIHARLQAFGELLADGELDVEDAVFVQVATPSRASGSSSTAILRDDIEALVGRINGELGQDRSAGDPLPAPVVPPRGAGRALPGRRRHARDAAARRHEPGRQGVRRLPLRRTTGALVLTRVRRCGRRAAPGLAGQPVRHRRDEVRLHARPTGPGTATWPGG